MGASNMHKTLDEWLKHVTDSTEHLTVDQLRSLLRHAALDIAHLSAELDKAKQADKPRRYSFWGNE